MEKILVIRNDKLGDFMQAWPAFAMLKLSNPSLKLTALEQEKIEQVTCSVGLGDYLQRLPNSLSGGQKQRVALARCLLRDKPILLLDEPFSALDQKLRVEMLALIAKLCDEKHLTLLLVTHQPSELVGTIDQVLLVENGQISQLQKEA